MASRRIPPCSRSTRPRKYNSWLGNRPNGLFASSDVSKNGADVVHLFVTSLAELDGQLSFARRHVKANGAIWVSWNKKAAKIPPDVTEDAVRESALKTDLADVKVSAVTDIWSGLKLVVRKHLR